MNGLPQPESFRPHAVIFSASPLSTLSKIWNLSSFSSLRRSMSLGLSYWCRNSALLYMKATTIRSSHFNKTSMMFRTKHSLLLLFGSLLHIANAQISGVKPCYAADGGASPDFPCNPEADVSACCGGGWRCRTNLFCEATDGVDVRGTCTDRNWANSNNPACPFPLSTRPCDPFYLRQVPFVLILMGL